MNKEITKKEKIRIFMIKLYSVMMLIGIYCSNACIAFADTDYGKKAGTWMLNQILWGVLVVLGFTLLGCLLKRAYTAAIIDVIVAAIVCYFISNPTKISSIGSSLATEFGF